MDKILSIQTIKNVFAALGAKTSDSNYGVALLDKTSAEPKGLMGMSELASVLGVVANALPTKGWTNNVDADNLTWGIIYTGMNGTNLPGDYCYLLTMGDTSSDFAQLAICRNTNKMFFRVTTGAGSWKEV